MEYEHILSTITNIVIAMVAANVINLAARLVDSATCSKLPHPLAACKFQDFAKNIWEVWSNNESHYSRKWSLW
jgi:hypothetical protein